MRGMSGNRISRMDGARGRGDVRVYAKCENRDMKAEHSQMEQ